MKGAISNHFRLMKPQAPLPRKKSKDEDDHRAAPGKAVSRQAGCPRCELLGEYRRNRWPAWPKWCREDDDVLYDNGPCAARQWNRVLGQGRRDPLADVQAGTGGNGLSAPGAQRLSEAVGGRQYQVGA